MIVSVNLSEDEYKFINSYAEEKNLSLSDFFISSAINQIEDEEDLRLYEKAKAEFDDEPITYSHEEVKKMFGLDK